MTTSNDPGNPWTARLKNHWPTTQQFVMSVGVLFLLSASAKLISASGNVAILKAIDPLLGVSFRTTLIAVGVCEILLAIHFLIWATRPVNANIIFVVSLLFGAYRLFSVFQGGEPCPCLGTITNWMPISDLTVTRISFGLFSYIFLGSLSIRVCRDRLLHHKR